jgi:hypothetical protein
MLIPSDFQKDRKGIDFLLLKKKKVETWREAAGDSD